MCQQNKNKTHKDCTICGLVWFCFLFDLFFIWFIFGGRALLYILWLLLGPRLAVGRFACQCGQTVVASVCPGSSCPAEAIKNRIRNRSTCNRRSTEWRTRSDWQVRRDSGNNNKFGVGWGVVWEIYRLTDTLQRESQRQRQRYRQRWRSCEWGYKEP